MVISWMCATGQMYLPSNSVSNCGYHISAGQLQVHCIDNNWIWNYGTRINNCITFFCGRNATQKIIIYLKRLIAISSATEVNSGKLSDHFVSNKYTCLILALRVSCARLRPCTRLRLVQGLRPRHNPACPEVPAYCIFKRTCFPIKAKLHYSYSSIVEKFFIYIKYFPMVIYLILHYVCKFCSRRPNLFSTTNTGECESYWLWLDSVKPRTVNDSAPVFRMSTIM